MADELKLAFSIDSADAVKGVADVEKALGGVKTATTAANTAVAELSGTLKSQLGPAGEAAYAAFEKLSKAEGPRALQRGIVDATIAMENFKKATDQAAASGQKIPAGVGTALKTMQADIGAATTKLGQLKDTMGDVATRSNQAGQSFEYLKGAGGGVGGMLNALESSTSKTLSSLGKLGIASVGIAGIFGTAVLAGKGLGAALDFVTERSQKLADTQAKGKAAAEAHAAAMRALDAGLIANSDSVQGLLRNYENLILAQGRGSAAARQAAADFAGVGDALKNYALETQKAETLGALLEGSFKRSGREGAEMARLMEAAIRKIEVEYRALGDAVPAGIRKALDALDALADRNKKALESAQEFSKGMAYTTNALHDLTEVNNAYSGSIDRITERTKIAEKAQREMTAAIEADIAAKQKEIAATDSAAEAATRFAEAQKNGIAFQEQSTIIQIQAYEATEKQNAALEELLKTQNAYSDSLANTLDIAKGWKDYLAVLVDSYQSGATSLLAYRQALQMFETQLLQTFGGATGKAKEALEEIIRTIEKLIATAGAGGAGGQGLTDVLNRMFQ